MNIVLGQGSAAMIYWVDNEPKVNDRIPFVKTNIVSSVTSNPRNASGEFLVITSDHGESDIVGYGPLRHYGYRTE